MGARPRGASPCTAPNADFFHAGQSMARRLAEASGPPSAEALGGQRIQPPTKRPPSRQFARRVLSGAKAQLYFVTVWSEPLVRAAPGAVRQSE